MTGGRRHERGPRLPLGLAVALLTIGVVAAWALGLPDRTLPIGVSIIAATPLVLVAGRRLVGAAARWVTAVADAFAVTLVAGLPRWWTTGAQARADHPPPTQALHLAGLLVVLLVLFVLLQTLSSGGARTRTRGLLVAGLVALAGYAGVALHASTRSGAVPWWAVALPVLAGSCWATVVCRPLSPRAAAVVEDQLPSASPARVVLLAVLGSAAPASLLMGSAPITTDDVVPVIVSCALLALCSVSHLVWRAQRAGLAAHAWAEVADQQRTLVRVGQGLLQARDRAQVARAAAAGGVQVLVASGAARAAVAVALGPPDLLELVAVDSTGLELVETAGLDLDQLSAYERGRLGQGEVVLRDLVPEPGEPASGDALLLLPLRSRDRELGALLVAGPRPSLLLVRSTLEAFAVQVSLALDAASASRHHPAPPTADGTDGSVPVPGLVAAIAQGLRQSEFRPHYQPVVDMRDGSVVGFEALVRWEHPARGPLLPAAFLAAVEDAGLLTALDDHLLGQACRDLVDIERADSGPYVSINLSRGQLADPGLVQRVRAALATSGLAPWRLQLEVTETAALEIPEQTAWTLGRLRDMQVRVAFDDFGTGQSSLSWLHQLPLDVVKLDRSFVEQLPTPPGAPPVVAAVAALSHVLGLSVIAEGVETQEQEQELLSMGVRYAQGWLYARALPAPQARAFARAPRQRPAVAATPARVPSVSRL